MKCVNANTVKLRKQAAACTNFFQKILLLLKEIYLYFHNIWHQFHFNFIKSQPQQLCIIKKKVFQYRIRPIPFFITTDAAIHFSGGGGRGADRLLKLTKFKGKRGKNAKKSSKFRKKQFKGAVFRFSLILRSTDNSPLRQFNPTTIHLQR